MCGGTPGNMCRPAAIPLFSRYRRSGQDGRQVGDKAAGGGEGDGQRSQVDASLSAPSLRRVLSAPAGRSEDSRASIHMGGLCVALS